MPGITRANSMQDAGHSTTQAMLLSQWSSTTYGRSNIMAYTHILIAVDLSPESKVLVEKAVSMARPYNAKVSLIHVDVNYSDLYTGLIDVNLGDMQKRISEETHHALTELSTNAGYPITETLSGSGDLGQVLVDAIKKYDMDLVVCGHHQDFWSKLMSSARQLINTVHVDMLIVPLRDEEDE
jgi:universal stress protein A